MSARRWPLWSVLALAVGVAWWSTIRAPTVASAPVVAGTAVEPRATTPGGVVRLDRPEAPPDRPPGDDQQALARAYAAAGAAQDGDPHLLTALDPLARISLPVAQRLLSGAVAQPGRAVPSTFDGGSMAVAPRAGAPAAADPTPASPPGSALGNALPPGSGGSAPPSSVGPSALSSRGLAATSPSTVARRLDGNHLPERTSALQDTVDGPELLLPGYWAVSPFRPSIHSRGLRIANHSEADYAVSLESTSGDFSNLRLDGGLVVPGRFYRLPAGRTTAVTGDVPASAVIRPLDALPHYYEQPQRPPMGSG